MSINSLSCIQSLSTKCNKTIPPLSASLIIWNKFNGNLNNSAPNYIGTNNGTYITSGGGTQTQTTISPALSNNTTVTNMNIFNGGGSPGGLITYIDYGTISNVVLSKGFSICMFIYNTKTSGGDSYIYTLNQTASNISAPNFNGGFCICQVSNSTYRSFTFNNYGLTNSVTINQNTWTHYCVTINSSNIYNVYLNGVLTVTNQTNPGTYPTSTTFTNNLFGWYGNGGAGHNSFQGNIADYRLYNTVLTATEILGIYNGTI
jgi:hypothetical protein